MQSACWHHSLHWAKQRICRFDVTLQRFEKSEAQALEIKRKNQNACVIHIGLAHYHEAYSQLQIDITIPADWSRVSKPVAHTQKLECVSGFFVRRVALVFRVQGNEAQNVDLNSFQQLPR